MENQCYFKWKYNCDDKGELTRAGPARIESVIRFSKEYKDNVHVDLVDRLEKNPELTIEYHRSCVSTYTSQQHLSRHRKREGCTSVSASQPLKKQRRSDVPVFRFKENCLFCGELCQMEKDKKHPDRRKKAVLCRTAYAGPGKKAFKESILEACTQRNDDIANQVRVRVEGALSVLHAADARYHQYQLFGGKALLRRSLLVKIQHHFLDDIAVLSSPGLSSLVVFRQNASTVLHLAGDTEDDTQDLLIGKLAKIIRDEVKQIDHDQSRYNTRITKEDMSTSVSQTVMDLLAALTDNLKDTFPALLIANIITSVLSNKPTNRQIALGNLTRDSKSLLNQLYQFRVTCSYDVILRFKRSAALAATRDIKLSGINQGSLGLIQTVADNFDADISSQNGKITTHSLAMLITQPTNAYDDEQNTRESIPRISKSDMSREIDFEIPVQRYQGPKIVPMLDNGSKKSVLPLKALCRAILSERRAKELDIAFLRDITNNEACPEYNGYNTMVTRQQGVSMQPKTKAVYLPLIDMTPSDPDTIMTALHEAKRLTKERGQNNAIFTSDQQLYKVAVEVQWAYPREFSDVINRLGGMHTLTSFAGAVGTLMQGSGLSEVLESTFAGVTKMLSGKKFPQNIRAMRLVLEEMLRSTMSDGSISTMEELLTRLDHAASTSNTSKLWVDCFIKPVFIMMLYVRAEREGDWPLHLVAVKQMLPYFFASSHINYARYGLYYLRSMERLGQEELSKFMKGEHVMHHVPGLWNGIWSDMLIETTFMRYGHGPGGIIGITLKPETLKTWALSLHICSRLEQDIITLVGKEQDISQEAHKEEMKARIASDGADRQSIQNKLKLCIDPLDPSSHPPTIVNIVSGQVADDTVNVHDAVAIGTKQMQEFEKGWSEGFRSTISKKVKTVSDSKKHIKVGSQKVYDTSVIYSRVIGIQASSRDIGRGLEMSFG